MQIVDIYHVPIVNFFYLIEQLYTFMSLYSFITIMFVLLLNNYNNNNKSALNSTK